MAIKPRKEPAQSAQELSSAIDQIELMIEQINQLYQQYLLGIQDRPPVEKRTVLEAEIKKLASGRRSTALRFRVQGILSRYATHRERWDKTMRDLESGKLQRKSQKKSPKAA